MRTVFLKINRITRMFLLPASTVIILYVYFPSNIIIISKIYFSDPSVLFLQEGRHTYTTGYTKSSNFCYPAQAQFEENCNFSHSQENTSRDIPTNIQLPTSTSILADFGYSRFYKENTGEFANRNIDMESLAGTPVFMAPEALYCVMYPGGSYDHTVDIWSVGALLYRVLVGKCGFFAPIQDILRILKAKGDAIAFTRHSRKTTYVRELPPEVDDILTPVFKDRMTWLIKRCLVVEATNRITYDAFFETVDDLVQTKIRLVSVHSGLESKIPYGDGPLLLSELRIVIHTDFNIQLDNIVIIRDTLQAESTITDQSDLDRFVNFSKSQQFGSSGKDPKLFLLDQSILSQMDPPLLPLLAYEELTEFLKSPERIEEVRTRDNIEFIPQIFSKLVKDIDLTADSQVSGLSAYIQYALGAKERQKYES
ncbi:Inhibitor of nuclear factor kappa-B kinase subunit beta-like [Oopsacas minuta]|uniref:Inhibitor of nuclear factor kappa-B kinase subunit beta-like n=1 Tax=Oopsacas minuta TaxID=111878 RepID=A0AAV7JBH0_9METZ|nr:Inhibitor of nuclear factor kappa-B kinase subunit beta-like [Oopsacas minuta]